MNPVVQIVLYLLIFIVFIFLLIFGVLSSSVALGGAAICGSSEAFQGIDCGSWAS